MPLLRLLPIFALGLALSGCSLFHERIDNYDDRSTVYGWIDIKDIPPNHLSSITLYQHRPATDKPYYYMGWRKLKGGYVFWSHIQPNGAFKLDTITGQSCLFFLCGNTIYSYSLGKQGDYGTAVINKPGVYYMGSYKLSEIKMGWLEPDKFSIDDATDGPTRQEMLELILQKDVPAAFPVVGQRIRRELGK